jgi:hypothetical protein
MRFALDVHELVMPGLVPAMTICRNSVDPICGCRAAKVPFGRSRFLRLEVWYLPGREAL